MKAPINDRPDYNSPKGKASWWQKDGYWHIALPGTDCFGNENVLLWTADEFDTREEAVAAIEAQ